MQNNILINDLNIINVVVGVIVKNNQALLAWRTAEKDQGNCYEFPGGKVERGEVLSQALTRELQEEIGIVPTAFSPFQKVDFDYPEKKVRLWFFYITEFEGEPEGKEGQQVRWVALDQLHLLTFPAANQAIVRALQLPELYRVTPSALPLSLTELLSLNHSPYYLRQPKWSLKQYHSFLLQNRLSAKWVLPFKIFKDLVQSFGFQTISSQVHGVHLTELDLFEKGVTQQINQIKDHYPELSILASCHDLKSAMKAESIGCMAITLSPVLPTPTHPNTSAIGWQEFKNISNQVWLPVYALGGLSPEDLVEARQQGAYGVSGIRNFI